MARQLTLVKNYFWIKINYPYFPRLSSLCTGCPIQYRVIN